MDHFFLWPALGLMTAVLVICLIASLRAHRSRELLREQNVLFDAALSNMVQGLNMFDQAGRLVLSNERYSEMYRLPRGAVKPGLTVRELVDCALPPARSSRSIRAIRQRAISSIADRKPTHATLELADGRVIDVVNQPWRAAAGW